MKTPSSIARTLALTLAHAALCAGIVAASSASAGAAALVRAKSFEGNINFTGTQASLQSKAGGAKACDLLSSASGNIALPANASVVSAILYWAGTGAVDPEVLLNGASVSAPAERRYSSSIDGFTYFAAAADVTAQVQGKSAFTFGGLTVDTSDTYCSKKQKENSMVAGFALAVVYAHGSERYRTVNVYEGLQAVKNTSVTVPMPDYVPSAENTGTGRIGYIVWEGDKTGQQKGDHVTFAGEVLRNEPFIQKDNAFNSKSSAGSDENSGSIDFDIVDLAGPPATPADAKAVFTTASDRVLLGAAILALPSKAADLAIKKTQAGDFVLGNEITYTLAVTNQGARADAKVEVRDTLSGLLTFLSASGPDWTCTFSEGTVVCKYGKPLLPGATASVVIKARITTDGKVVNTATVSGTADSVPGNDQSTVEGDTGKLPLSRDPFVFTTGPCNADEMVKSSGPGCALFTGPVKAGSKPTIYITRTVGGLTKPYSTTAKTNVTVRLSLECNMPTTPAPAVAPGAPVKVEYAGKDLGTCLSHDPNRSYATVGVEATLEYAAKEVSKPAQFFYPDVGRVTLRLRDSAGNVVKTTFDSLPTKLRAVFVRTDDGFPNPGTATLAQPGFAEAGEPFRVVVSAHGVDNGPALPNFGRETDAFSLLNKLQILVDGGGLAQNLLESQDDWKWDKTFARTFVWNEVGTARLSASLTGYLGSTDTFTTDEPTTVGRFYPAYFRTETDGGFGCLPRMLCPTEASQVVTRATYSRQPFRARISAWGRNKVQSQKLEESGLVPPITLSAVSRAGDNATPLNGLVDGGPKDKVERTLSYQLAKGYHAKVDSPDAGTSGWTPPTAVYLRATAPELRATPAGAASVTISSLHGTAGPSAEGGIMVLNGRLLVSSTIGAPLGKTPVPLVAQYWSGAAWEANSFVEQTEPVTGSVLFTDCRRSLRDKNGTGGACDLNVVKVAGTQTGNDPVVLPMLKEGKANLILAPVGDRTGNVDMFVNGVDYLPSTIGRATFGQFKSPVIYVREMY